MKNTDDKLGPAVKNTGDKQHRIEKNAGLVTKGKNYMEYNSCNCTNTCRHKQIHITEIILMTSGNHVQYYFVIFQKYLML